MTKSKFIKLWKLVMEEITAGRKPIQKVDAMGPRDFLKFLREFLPYVKNGKVDLNDVRVTEKVDGQHLELCTVNGEMMFESSYSKGPKAWNDVPMKEAAKFLYDNYSQLFGDIHDLIGSDFRLIGELIWIDDPDNTDSTGKVTPVAASYLISKFGKHGGMVVFDIVRPDENWHLQPFGEEKMGEEEHKIFNMIRDLNNEDFAFYLSESIDRTKNVTFTLDVDQILQLISSPEFNKERFDKKKDAKTLEEIEKIKQSICAQLSKVVDSTGGSFSEEGDLIEGIVVRINSSGNQYGMFSDKYRDIKHKYWNSFEQVEPIWNEFFKSVFGCVPMRKKKDLYPKLEEDFNQFKDKFDELRPEYLKKMQDAVDALTNDNDIPKAAKRVQMSMAKNQLAKLQEADYSTFVNKYILFKGEELV